MALRLDACETGKGKHVKKRIERYGTWIQERCRALPEPSRSDERLVDHPEAPEVLHAQKSEERKCQFPWRRDHCWHHRQRRSHRHRRSRGARLARQVLNIQEFATALSARELRQQQRRHHHQQKQSNLAPWSLGDHHRWETSHTNPRIQVRLIVRWSHQGKRVAS